MSLPLVLDVPKAEMDRLLESELPIALKCSAYSEQILAVIPKPVFFKNRKNATCSHLFGTSTYRHPSILEMEKYGDWLLTCDGPMRFIKRLERGDGMDQFRLTAQDIKNIFL